MTHTIQFLNLKGHRVVPEWQVDPSTMQILLFEDVFVVNEHLFAVRSRESHLGSTALESGVKQTTLTVKLFMEDLGDRKDPKVAEMERSLKDGGNATVNLDEM